MVSKLLDCIRSLQRSWMEYREVIDATAISSRAYQAETLQQGRGRPRFQIEKDQLEYLSSLSFNWCEIAALLGVSRMTVYRYEYQQ